MDEFGVLTERFGLKPQGKGAPMSAVRRQPAPSPSGAYDFNAFGGGGRSPPSSSFDYLDSVFSTAKSSPPASSSYGDDFFGSFVSKPAPAGDDLLGGFVAPSKLKPPPVGRVGSADGLDDLMPGFGSSSSGSNGATGISFSVSSDDPIGILESTSTAASQKKVGDPLDTFDIFNQSSGQKHLKTSNATSSLKPPPMPGQVLKTDKVKTSGKNLIDELEDFSWGGARNGTGKELRERHNGKTSKYREAEDAARKAQQKSPDDLLSSSVSFRSNSVPKSRAPMTDTLFDFDLDTNGGAETFQKVSSDISSGINKVSSAGNLVDDLYSMLGDTSFFGNFEEIQGESEERRNARLGRQQRTQDRMAKAVADMNQRDRQTQNEQEERRIIAEQMDVVIKRWASGKQGNLRALMSSLQQVLWPECGWEPLSLTDLVTSASVKKAYRKAALCVHPDKVQQKGSTLHEKYIAEKVFDILKEAWNKFNREER